MPFSFDDRSGSGGTPFDLGDNVTPYRNAQCWLFISLPTCEAEVVETVRGSFHRVVERGALRRRARIDQQEQRRCLGVSSRDGLSNNLASVFMEPFSVLGNSPENFVGTLASDEPDIPREAVGYPLCDQALYAKEMLKDTHAIGRCSTQNAATPGR